MYRVITPFLDLEDNEHRYDIGDTYPREGLSPSSARIAFLMSDKNKLGTPVIERAPADLTAMTVTELRDYAAAHGIELGDRKKKADILAAITEG